MQSVVIELGALLGVEPPTHEPHAPFERPVTFQHGDGTPSAGRVDCYKRGTPCAGEQEAQGGQAGPAFTGQRPTQAFDDAMLKACTQAENHARTLPASEGRTPFVVVVDVGHVIELCAEFIRSGATCTPFPDSHSHRIWLVQMVEPAIRAGLQALWTDPLGLDPARISAKVPHAVANELAKSLEAASPTPLSLPAIEAAFKGQGPWKKSLPRLLDTLEALGRARQEGGGWRG